MDRLDLIRETLYYPGTTVWNVKKDILSVLTDYQYIRTPYIFKIKHVVRAVASKDINWFNKLSCLGYPPKKYVKKFARCNIPQEPVFYCSSENGVPIFEIRPSIGQYIVLSYWESNHKSEMELLGLAVGVEAIMKSLREDSPFRTLLMIDDLFKNEVSEDIKEVDRYIAQLFVQIADDEDDRLYWLTSAVSKILFENMQYQGLLYPSVASQITGANAVLTTDFVDGNLHVFGASMYQVIDKDETKMEYKLSIVKSLTGRNSDGTLRWQDIQQQFSDKIWVLSPQTPTLPYSPEHILPIED